MGRTLGELFKPRAAGERAFFDKHKVRETPDPYGNGDDVRNGSAVKEYNRKRDRMGYSSAQAIAAYDKENSKGSNRKPNVVVPATAVGNWNSRDGYDDQVAAEEVEVELDELSKVALRTYKKKAGAGMLSKARDVSDKETFQKRKAGLAVAQKKLDDFKYGEKKEEVELDEYVSSRNKNYGFHGSIAGTNEEKKKLYHSFHRWVAQATGIKMTEDPDLVRNFLDSAHGRFIAHRINANHPKEDVHHHTLARWKAFKQTYSPNHFNTVGEDVAEAWDMPTPMSTNSAYPTIQVKPDRRVAKWSAGDEIRRAARYHNDQAGEYSAKASEHRHHAEMSKKAKKHSLAGHHWALDGVMRKASKIHDAIAKHYQMKVGKHH